MDLSLTMLPSRAIQAPKRDSQHLIGPVELSILEGLKRKIITEISLCEISSLLFPQTDSAYKLGDENQTDCSQLVLSAVILRRAD